MTSVLLKVTMEQWLLGDNRHDWIRNHYLWLSLNPSPLNLSFAIVMMDRKIADLGSVKEVECTNATCGPNWCKIKIPNLAVF